MVRVTVLMLALLCAGCATKPKQYQPPSDVKMKAAEHRLNTAVTRSRETAAKVKTQVQDVRDAAVRVAALVAAAQVSIEVINGFDQSQIPAPVRAAIKTLADTVQQMSNELRDLMTKFDALKLTVEQLGVDQREEEAARIDLATEQANYRGEAQHLAQDATDERNYRIKDEKALSWYRWHWWGAWIGTALLVIGFVVVVTLVKTGKLALKAAI